LQNTLPFQFREFLCVTVWLWLPVTQCHANLKPAMAPPVSLELRERIIAWKYELNMPISVIAQLANRCEKTVKNVLKTYRDYNQPTNPFIRPRGRKRVLDRDDLNYIESILLAEPALFLDEIQDKLFVVRDVEVSISTLSRTLNRLAITHKAVAKEAMERNEHLRATWQINMAQYDPCQLVFVDEAGVDDRTNIRTNGWAPLGQACVRRTTFLRGQKYSILPALSQDGILALDIFEGSVNHERFVGFLRNHLVCLFFIL
jgi:transposase